MKMNLALNNLQMLICHKTQTAKLILLLNLNYLFAQIWIVSSIAN